MPPEELQRHDMIYGPETEKEEEEESCDYPASLDNWIVLCMTFSTPSAPYNFNFAALRNHNQPLQIR